jgi:AcrR family transcriptional regulator
MSGSNTLKRLGRPPREAAERLTDKVLETAMSLFAERGYEATSMAAIAAEAQVGKHTIYRRYPDKAALFRACIERTADCIIEARSGSAAEAGDPLVTLRQVMMRAALVATDPQMIALYRMTIAEAVRFPELGTIFADLENDRLIKICADLIEQAQSASLIRADENKMFLASLLLEISAGFVIQQGLAGVRMGPDAVADYVARTWRIFLEGAGCRNARAG